MPLTSLLLTSQVFSCVYAYEIVSRRAPGVGRILLSLPVFLVLLYMPLAIKAQSSSAFLLPCVVYLNSTFLSSFKLLAFAMGRGVLAESSLKPWQFYLLFLLPVSVWRGPQVPAQRQGKAVFNDFGLLLLKGAGLGCVLLCLDKLEPHGVVKHIFYSIGFWLCLNIVLDGPLAAVANFLHLPLKPSFDAPYQSRSVRELWSRRWNQSVATVLRDVVYEPILEGRVFAKSRVEAAAAPVPQPSQTRKVLGSLAVFFVSGVMHEIWLRYFCTRFTGKHLLFFTLQAPAILLQDAVMARVPHSVRSTAWCRRLQVAVTMAIVLGLAELFWSGFEECGLEDGILEVKRLLGMV